jgi:hypothetical protein
MSTKNIHLIQVTEALPPKLNGIGDYAYKLASCFREFLAIDSTFLVLDHPESYPDQYLEYPVYNVLPFPEHFLTTLTEVIENHSEMTNIILFHECKGTLDRYISPKSFDRHFLPLRLLEFLRKLKVKHSSIKLIILFHEFLWPTPERRRDYLLRPLQNLFMKRVLEYSPSVICNNPVSAHLIKQLSPQTNILVNPVFSNIGELSNNSTNQKQKGSWVIFGTTEHLLRTVSMFVDDIHLIRKTYQIDSINIIGGVKNDYILHHIKRIKQFVPCVNYLPEIPSLQVSQIFRKSRFCYLNYFSKNIDSNTALIFKSGVFAAACSHGVIPVFCNVGMEYAMNYLEHPGYIFIKNGQLNIFSDHELDHLANNLISWYNKYCSAEMSAKRMYRLFGI